MLKRRFATPLLAWLVIEKRFTTGRCLVFDISTWPLASWEVARAISKLSKRSEFLKGESFALHHFL